MPIKSEVVNWQKWSEKDWENWLNERLEERKEVFGSDPDELISSYNRERSHASSYGGKELLELIQNADDSGAEHSAPNKMFIQLTPKALYAANTGVPFSPEGIKSLMVSDVSPKQRQRGLIGYKGLGFRSVLGWASFIVIRSGKLSIGFSEKNAIYWLRALIKENAKVREKIERVRKEGLLNPIATLSIPYLFNPTNSKEIMYAEVFQTIHELHNKGYDTVICLIFDKPEETHEKVQIQIENMNAEILLFLQHLERLETVTPKTKMRLEAKRSEHEVIINPEDKDKKQVWRLFSDSDEIPEEYQRPDQPLVSKYELKLATSCKNPCTNRLFVYFPTEVLFPFPLVVHATFELTDNRQHLIESDINKFIANKLAGLIVNSAEKLTDPENSWGALLSVTPRGDIDPILSKLGFEEKLRTGLVSKKIIPVRCKQFETAKNVKIIEGNFDDLLIGEEFKDICLYTEDPFLKKRLSDIGVEPLQYDDLKERLNRLSRTVISMNTRAEIIYRLIDKGIVTSNTRAPELLVDENGSPIPTDAKALLPPEGKKFSLPEWVLQRIVNLDLAALLKEKFKLTTVRDLVSKLRAFDVQEYSMTALVSSIIAETNRRVKEEPDKELTLRQEMLRAIWALYSSQKSEERPTLPETTKVILPNRGGSFEPAESLYLGKEYPDGELLEYFYGPLGGPFVGSPTQLGLQSDINEIKLFLCWLGVAELPRVVKIDKGYGECSEFLDDVLEAIQYPARFGDVILNSKNEVMEAYPKLREVSTIDRLESVLAMTDPHAVVCWIVRSFKELGSWRTNGDTDAKLTICPPYKQYRRTLENEVLPSYPFWLLCNTKWLPLTTGEKQRPSMCTLARGVSKEVSALVGYPSLDLKHPLLESAKVDKTTLKNALATIGVVTELDELSWDSFYEILLELPQKDPEGKAARSVYRALIGRGGDSDTPSGEKREKFLKEGKMFGRFGEKTGYFPVTELYYFENPTLPESMLRLFPSLALDRRRGGAKVKRFFGVEPFNLSTAQVTVKDFEEHPCSPDFQMEVNRLKQYIYALRVEEDSDCSELKSLKQLEVKLCRSAKCTIHVGKEEKEIILQSGESIIVDSVAYLVAEPSEYDKPFIRDVIIADALGNVITNILKVEIGGDIARLAMSPNGKRSILLDKITGGSGEVRLIKANESIQLALDEEEFTRPPQIPPQPPSAPSFAGEPKLDNELDSVVPPDSVGPVSVSGGDQVPIIPFREIKRRVMVNTRPGGTRLPKGSRVNPERAVNLAIEFEKEQARFAEKISHFQGSEAYGCDILSFKTKQDMENFKTRPDTKLIERFIEVKGSTNSVGAVTLEGNELRCAQNNRNKFFLYRVYEGEKTGSFELVETPDPLGVETGALRPKYEIHPFRTKRSKLWDVTEIDEGEKE